jgi:hypothetical protein
MNKFVDSNQSLNQIQTTLNQILTNIKNYHEISSILKTIIVIKDINEIIEFTRIDSPTKINCSFCKKLSYYQDNDNKYYCWFHRSQYE